MWVVGWAMAARGEFAYLVAETALETEVAGTEGEGPHGGFKTLMSEEVYAAVIWAFLICTVASPLAFKYVLQQRLAAVEIQRSHSIGPKSSGAEGRHGKHAVGAFGVRVEGMHRPGLLLEVLDIFRVAELEVVEANCETDGDLDVFQFTVAPRDGTGDVGQEKLDEVRHEALEALDDPNGTVVFTPIAQEDTSMLEIQLTAGHRDRLFVHILEKLRDLQLDVVTADAKKREGDTDVDVLFVRRSDDPGAPISPGQRDAVKGALMQLLREHNTTGEAMVKVPDLGGGMTSRCPCDERPVLLNKETLLRIGVAFPNADRAALVDIAGLLTHKGFDVQRANI